MLDSAGDSPASQSKKGTRLRACSIRCCYMNPFHRSLRGSPVSQSIMTSPLSAADQATSASAANQTLALDRTAAAHSIAAAGKQIAALRDQISNQRGDDKAQALYELDQVGAKIDHALEEVVSLSIAVNADRHELVAGENFIVEVNLPG